LFVVLFTPRIPDSPAEGNIIDLSLAGLLFAYPGPPLVSSLRIGSEVTVKLETPNRVIKTAIRVVRRFMLQSAAYLDCRFLNMGPEDLRFLFEFIYDKPFSAAEASFLTNQV
jgi:hypothetical protein